MEKAMKRDKIEVNDRQVCVKCLYSSFSCFEAQWKTIFLDEDRIVFRAFMGFSLCIVIGGGSKPFVIGSHAFRAFYVSVMFWLSSINLIKVFCFRHFLFIVVLWLTGLLLTYCSLSYSYDFFGNKSRLLNFIFLHTYIQPLFIHDIHSKLQVCTKYKLKIKMLKIINSRG